MAVEEPAADLDSSGGGTGGLQRLAHMSHTGCDSNGIVLFPHLETGTHASTPAYDHSGPAWSYRPFYKCPFHLLRLSPSAKRKDI